MSYQTPPTSDTHTTNRQSPLTLSCVLPIASITHPHSRTSLSICCLPSWHRLSVSSVDEAYEGLIHKRWTGPGRNWELLLRNNTDTTEFPPSIIYQAHMETFCPWPLQKSGWFCTYRADLPILNKTLLNFILIQQKTLNKKVSRRRWSSWRLERMYSTMPTHWSWICTTPVVLQY